MADHDHDHSHHHSHDHHQGGGLGHRVRELFGGHSHDPGDSVDNELETSAQGMRALVISFAVLLVTALLQAVVVVLSGSVALLGDTLHNFADALTALPLAVAFTLGRRAATRRFTYGYGRSEDLAGLVVLALIAASAVLAGYEAVHRLIHPAEVNHLGLLGAAAVVGFVGNEVVARYRITVGRRIGSAGGGGDGGGGMRGGLGPRPVEYQLHAAGCSAWPPPRSPPATCATTAWTRSTPRSSSTTPHQTSTAECSTRSAPGIW